MAFTLNRGVADQIDCGRLSDAVAIGILTGHGVLQLYGAVGQQLQLHSLIEGSIVGMLQRFKQRGLQLLADDGDGEYRIATIGIPADDYARLKEQRDRATGHREQVGRQPAFRRKADKTQNALGSACSIRAIAAARRCKQTG